MKKLLLIFLIVILAGCNSTAAEAPASATPGPAATTAEIETESPPTGEAAAETAEVEPEAVEIEEEAEPDEAEMAEEAVEAETDPTPAEEALDHGQLLGQLLFSISSLSEGQAILDQIEESGDTRFVGGLIDSLRFQPFLGSSRGVGDLSQEIGDTLNALTGQELEPDWFAWVEWAGQHPEIESFESYPGWKGRLFATLIDPQFARFVNADMKIAPDSRPEEIVWGGVRVDGIPALDNPTMIDPEEADYLVPDERVFGVSINGDTRAYPARFLDWHEMFNDIVGGEPVSLAY